MLIGLLQLRHSLQEHTRIYLFVAFVALTWLVWLVKVLLSRHYRPWTEPHAATTSVVIPVVDEPIELFRVVLARIVHQQPTQTIVVINGRRNENLERVCAEFGGDVEWVWEPTAGKRNAVRVGVELSVGEIVVLVDSDTLWTDDTLTELVKPFRDPGVGGVTTRQRIIDPQRCFLTRWADWLENSRALYSMPAQSVLGTVGCLPGRTIAFRRAVLERAMDDFLTQQFLGILLEVSDDRTLTNLTLKMGLRTVYQSTSLVYTDAPTRLKKLVKQQFRWARGSQYNTLRMLPWMLGHAPVLAFFFLADIALPFLWACTAIAWLIRSLRNDGTDLYDGLLADKQHAVLGLVVLTVLLSVLSMALRQLRHLAEVPSDVLRMPLFILFSTLVLMPIRIYGFMRLGHLGAWGTRKDAYTVEQVDSPDVSLVTSSAAGATAVEAKPANAPATTHEPSRDGDPRGLIPYVIAIAVLLLGVAYDVLPV